MTASDPVDRLAAALRDALAGTLETLAPGIADVPAPEVLEPGGDALAGAHVPAVLAQAAPADAVTGPALLLLSVPSARRLAALLGAIGEEEAEFGGKEIGDRELSAVREVTSRVTTATASAITGLGDREAGFRPASVRVAEGATDLHLVVDAGMHAIVVGFTVFHEPARLVVLVPAALAVATRPAVPAPAPGAVSDMPLSGALRGVNVRVWAELGRALMPTGHVVGLPSGAIVELDRDAEDAVDLYVDGQHYATGRLVVTDDESWGVRIEKILAER